MLVCSEVQQLVIWIWLVLVSFRLQIHLSHHSYLKTSLKTVPVYIIWGLGVGSEIRTPAYVWRRGFKKYDQQSNCVINGPLRKAPKPSCSKDTGYPHFLTQSLASLYIALVISVC